MNIKRILITVVAGLLISTQASATVYPPKPPIPVFPSDGGGRGAGAAGVAGFIGFVAIIVVYDIWRRSNCVGDPLKLSRPGFYDPLTPKQGHVMIPVHQRGLCGGPARRLVRARG